MYKFKIKLSESHVGITTFEKEFVGERLEDDREGYSKYQILYSNFGVENECYYIKHDDVDLIKYRDNVHHQIDEAQKEKWSKQYNVMSHFWDTFKDMSNKKQKQLWDSLTYDTFVSFYKNRPALVIAYASRHTWLSKATIDNTVNGKFPKLSELTKLKTLPYMYKFGYRASSDARYELHPVIDEISSSNTIEPFTVSYEDRLLTIDSWTSIINSLSPIDNKPFCSKYMDGISGGYSDDATNAYNITYRNRFPSGNSWDLIMGGVQYSLTDDYEKKGVQILIFNDSDKDVVDSRLTKMMIIYEDCGRGNGFCVYFIKPRTDLIKSINKINKHIHQCNVNSTDLPQASEIIELADKGLIIEDDIKFTQLEEFREFMSTIPTNQQVELWERFNLTNLTLYFDSTNGGLKKRVIERNASVYRLDPLVKYREVKDVRDVTKMKLLPPLYKYGFR